LRAPIGLLARLAFDVTDVTDGIVPCLVHHLIEEGLLGFVARHAGCLLEALADRFDHPVVLGASLLDRLLPLPESVLPLADLRLALRESLDLAIDALLLLSHPLLDRDELVTLRPR